MRFEFLIIFSFYHRLGRTLRLVRLEIFQEKTSKGQERQKGKDRGKYFYYWNLNCSELFNVNIILLVKDDYYPL